MHETAQVMHRTVTRAVVTASQKLEKKEQCKALFQFIGLLHSQGIIYIYFLICYMSYEGGVEMKSITSCTLGKGSLISACALSPNNVIVLYMHSL